MNKSNLTDEEVSEIISEMSLLNQELSQEQEPYLRASQIITDLYDNYAKDDSEANFLYLSYGLFFLGANLANYVNMTERALIEFKKTNPKL